MKGEFLQQMAYLYRVADWRVVDVASQPPPVSYNSILNETEEVKNFRRGKRDAEEFQCFSVQTTMGIKIDRSIDCVQAMTRPTRQPHLLMWVNDARWATGVAEGSPLPNTVDTWVKILRGTLQPETGLEPILGECFQCAATCGEGECQGVKVLTCKPKRYDEAVHKVLRAEASDEDLEVWHPAITDLSPITAFAAVAYTAGYDSIQTLKQNHEIVFLAVETWQGQIDLTSRALMQEIAARIDFKGYSRERHNLTCGEIANKRISFTTRVCMVEEAGRKISDELFQPTKATRLSVVPQYIERSAKPLAEPYPEAYVAAGVKMSNSMMEELKRGGAQVLFRGKGNAAINNLDRAIRAENLNVATMNILEPNLVGCGASSMNQLRVAGKSRMCSCLAHEVLHPDRPKLLMIWSMEDLLNIGMPAPEGTVIPFLLSAYLPLVFIMNHQNLRPPTRHLIVTEPLRLHAGAVLLDSSWDA